MPAAPKLNAKNAATLVEVFARPTSPNVEWGRVVALVEALGGVVTERAGSRVAFDLGERTAVFHKPHPGSSLNRPAVRDFADFLRAAGSNPP